MEIKGIKKFKEYFGKNENQYVLIGGVACSLLLNDAGLDFRTTKDFDIVIIIEALDESFGREIWKFINDGEYEIRQRSNNKPVFYRFKNPKNNMFPSEIELFSKSNFILENSIMQIYISDDVSSLSAILLDDDYYEFLKTGLSNIDDIQILNYTHLIPFKIKAWLDLSKRKNDGEEIDSKKINKHKNDVLRLSQLLNNVKIETSDSIKNDIRTFVSNIEKEKIDYSQLKITGSLTKTLDKIKEVYLLWLSFIKIIKLENI